MDCLAVLFVVCLPFGAGGSEETRGLVADLGHPRWSRRVTAEKELLDRGEGAIDELRKALGSANPEKARRARFVLDRLDPAICVVDLARIELGETPRVVEVTRFSGENGKSTVASNRERRASGGYRVSFKVLSEDVAEVTIGRTTSSRATATRHFTGPSPAIHIYEVGSESRYLRCGLVLDRRRHPFLTLVYQRQGRRSGIEPETSPPGSEDYLEAMLVPTLLDQAQSDDLGLRVTALDALGRLRIVKARERFEAALEHPATFAAGAVGLALIREPGASSLLLEALRQAGGPRGTSQDAHSWKLRAAELLARHEEPAGIEHLLGALEGKNPLKQHRVLPPLSDASSWIGEVPSLRDRFLETALREDVITEAWWRDPELEHFLFRSIDLLDPRSSKDAALAARARSALEELAAGRSLLNRVSLARISPLWQKAEAVASGTGRLPDLELPLLERALENHENPSLLAEVVGEIAMAFTGKTVPPPLFEKLIERFRVELSTSEPGRLSSRAQRLLDLSRSIAIGEGQLAPWVTLLCEWAEVPGESLFLASAKRRLEDEIERWMGVDRRRSHEIPGQSREDPASPGAGTPGSVARPVTSPREWLADAKRVKEREEQLVEERATGSDGEGSGSIVYYEFELLLDEEDGSEPGILEVLDGRRLETEPGVEHPYRDAWGNRRSILLEPVASEGAKRYRLNKSRILFEGAPLIHRGTGKNLHHEWYATSNLFPRGRVTTRRSSSGYRTVGMVVRRAKDAHYSSGENLELDVDDSFVVRGASFRSGDRDAVEVEELWDEFLEHVLEPPGSLEPGQVTAYLHTLDQLAVPHTSKVLAKLLARAEPSLNSSVRRAIARRLVDQGDDRGIEALRRMAGSGAFQDRLVAAQELTALGLEDGLRALVNLARDIPRGPRSFGWKRQVLMSLLRYLAARGDREGRETEAALERDVASIALESIDDARFQTLAFSVIERLAGTDFGFRQAYRTRGAGRRAAIQAAVEKAREWAGRHDR